MSVISFFTLNVFCIAILVMVLINILKGADNRMEKNIFAMFVISAIVFCSVNVVWGIIRLTLHYETSQELALMVNMFHYYFMAIVAYMWFLFSEKEQGSTIVESAHGIILSSIPMMIYTIIAIGSYNYEWLFKFSLTESGYFERGKLFFVHVIICFGYIWFTAGKALHKSRKKENIKNKKRLTSLVVFPIFPWLIALVEIFVKSTAFIGMGITLAALQMYVDSREQLISLDPMTKLNNKSELYHYLDTKMKSVDGHKKLYIFMMDLDNFKSINDNYGHIEGDEAIMIMANVVHSIVDGTNYFACRYGGDEFSIVCEVSKNFDPDAFAEKIKTELKESVQKQKKTYTMDVSVGYSLFTDDYKNIPDYIEAADKMLYSEKAKKKALSI